MARPLGDVFRLRLQALKEAMATSNISCYLLGVPSNIYYLTGHLSASDTVLFLLIPLDSEATLYVHEMNYTQAEKEAEGCTVEAVKVGEEFTGMISAKVMEIAAKEVCFDELPTSRYKALNERMRDKKLRQEGDLVWKLRRVKDPSEMALLRRAAELSSKGVETALQTLGAGLREYQVAGEAEHAMRREGSWGVAFETIVASGPRSSWPHAICGERVMEEGDVVIVDIGALYGGYRSDITRTAFIGRPSEEQAKIYRTVCSVQEKTLHSLRAGMLGWVVDAIARRQIEEEGFGPYFPHGVGHGVGIDIHEPPKLSPKSKDPLEAGNVFTVEPAIYLPNRFGVRIEDTVTLTKSGVEVLTRCEKESY